MNQDERAALLALITGELEPAPERALRERLEEEPELRRELERLRAVAAAVAATRRERFRPGFPGRVLAALPDRPVRVIDLSGALRRQFRRLAPAAAAVLVGLAAWNLLADGRVAGQSTLEAAIGLDPVTLEAAYAFDPTLYAVGEQPDTEEAP